MNEEKEKPIQLQENDTYQDGDIFYAYVHFAEDVEQGKERPIVAMKDQDTDTWKAFKITSQIGKKLNHKYGYLMEDWAESGLTKPSIIKCDRESIYNIDPNNIIKKIGDLTEQDLKGLLMKIVTVREIEYRRERQKINEAER
ncbi:type II toxin-antitoxin system PemK/MazF family toxin [Metasolibacillus sp.]|uniref:type II toxin-antitoxin system PemK/MazF family toxin n=1 Tax=Metasolibacillus sp. TaxID=2703680 RepID=UPI0025F38B23|nr:type II toxin-antitoxin system PemK/MazF family toxin [Metasolibacillus sp.]MCT6922831.1 type II toxin-antitoxin system PemK/MazF family toxin [Metasolibacillus sp.]MCT6938830.1 type II toxin-antitoxin system PemK/MazF family toxin [Metasolibacillus sp.]